MRSLSASLQRYASCCLTDHLCWIQKVSCFNLSAPALPSARGNMVHDSDLGEPCLWVWQPHLFNILKHPHLWEFCGLCYKTPLAVGDVGITKVISSTLHDRLQSVFRNTISFGTCFPISQCIIYISHLLVWYIGSRLTSQSPRAFARVPVPTRVNESDMFILTGD